MELKANELRIGNYVYADFYKDDLILVESVCSNNEDIYNSTTGEIPLTSLKPIPLTEEWLLKFGFEKDLQVDLLRLQNELGTIVYYTENSIEKSKINFMLKNTCFMINTIKYVHELQNLYFALTNKELEIKM